MGKILIGLAGKMACGKGRVGSFLVQHYDAERIRSSDPLRQTVDLFGVAQSRENLSALSTFLRGTYGEDTIARSMSLLLLNSPKRVAVWDGMRRQIDVDHFRQFDQFYLVYIDASPEMRYRRTLSRNENEGDSSLTRASFDARDMLEPEQEIESLRAQADYVIENNLDSLEHLEGQIKEIMTAILKRAG